MFESTAWTAAIAMAAGIAGATISFAARGQEAQLPPIVTLAELPPRAQAAAARFLSHTKQIDGAISPEQLSLSDLLRGRLAALSSASAVEIAAGDRQILAAYAASESEALARTRSAKQRQLTSLCTQRTRMDSMSLATYLSRLEDEEEQATLSHYQAALDALSAQGRSRVQEYLRTEVAPRTMKATVDYVGLAADMPDQLAAQVALACSTRSVAPTTIEIEGDRHSNAGMTAVGDE